MTTTYTPANIIAGTRMPLIDESIVLEAISTDVALTAGTVLAKKSNTKFVKVDSNVVGATEPYAVLAEDTTIPANTDTTAVGYLTGEFNESKLVFGGTDTLSTHKTAMRKIGLFTKTTIA